MTEIQKMQGGSLKDFPIADHKRPIYSLGVLKEKQFCKFCRETLTTFQEEDGLYCALGHKITNYPKINTQHLLRKYLIQREGKCMNCGYYRFSEILELAHIIPRRKNGKTKLNNTLLLCPNCHKLFDKGLISLKKLISGSMQSKYIYKEDRLR